MNARGTLLLLGACLLGPAWVAAAAEPSVRLELSPTTTAPGQPVQATVTVTGGVRGFDVELATPSGVSTQRAGTSTNMQYINGDLQSSFQYFFQVVAPTAGTYTLGPAQAQRGGSVYKSNVATLTVTATPVAEQARDGGVYLEVEVDNPHPCLGEQVVYTLRLFRPNTRSLRNFQLNEPETAGLWDEVIDGDADAQTMVNGQPYFVHTRRKAYFPTRVGRAEIGVATVTYAEVLPMRRRPRSMFDMFDAFGDRTVARRVSSESIALDVQALPPPPPGVAEGTAAVGTFQLQSHVSDTRARVGDSITFTLTVSGAGNVRTLPDFDLPDSDAFKVYADVPAITVSPTGTKIEGTREQRIALVPQQAGAVTIPAFTLPVFDPATGIWDTLATAPVTLEVEPGENQTPLVVAADAAGSATVVTPPRRLATGLLAPHSLPADVRFAGTHERAATAATTVSAPMLFLVSWLTRKRARARAADPTLDRRRRAAKTARRALGARPAPDADGVASILCRYVADRIGVPTGAITGEEAIAIITAADAAAGANAAAVIRRGEAARYGGAANTGEGAISTAQALVTTLERLDLSGEVSRA